MTPTYRTDQIGSLVRPPDLLDARDAVKAGKLPREAIAEIEDRCILAALGRQRDIGVEVLSDGEMRRDAWQTVFSEAVDGFEDAYPIHTFERSDGTTARLQMHTKAVRAKLRQRRRLAKTDADFLRCHAAAPFKITMPSPAVLARASYKVGVTDTAYPDCTELLVDCVAISKGEVQALATEGVPYVQLDEGFTVYVDPDRKDQLAASSSDRDRAIESDIAAENACYNAARAAGAVTAMHLCRGSRASFGRGTGGYDWLAERLFDRLQVDRFLLEYDSDRVGGFEPLRYVPKGKIAVLGLVSSTDPTLERRDDLVRRIEAASKFCPVEQLAISSQCGFQGAASRDGAHMTSDQQWRKLELIVETARVVWG